MSDRKVRIDMHTHTEYSRDSRTTLRAFAAAAGEVGLDVVCVTDHDTIDGGLRLREMDVPFRVVVGEEIYSREGEIIGLFLERPVPPGLSAEETVGRIHDQGGIAYVPHPFSRNRVRHLRLATLERMVPELDAIEIFNAREAFAGDNRRALAFAVKHGLPGGVGSDAHRIGELGRAFATIPDFGDPAGLLVSLRSGEVTGTLSGMRAHVRTRYDVFRKWLRRRIAGRG